MVLLNDVGTHDATVELAKDMGIIMPNKPSVRLRGYDLNKIVGGIICKICKKSICICEGSQAPNLRLKNQDEFNRIQKHLHVVSEANQMDKLAFVTGLSNANLSNSMIGFTIEDIPALRPSDTAIGIAGCTKDEFVSSAI